jgi:hypothetical protein
MNFRYQAFNEDRVLCAGWIVAANETEAREQLEEIFVCIVQLSPSRFALGRPKGMNGHNLSINASEQFISIDEARPESVRTADGWRERRLIGHVEMYGGGEYLQFWTCLAVYFISALMLWMAFPPLWEVDVTDWLSEAHREGAAGYDTLLFRATVLVSGNSAASLVVLVYMLAIKQRLSRIALAMLAVYALQWVGCVQIRGTVEGPGAAYGFVQAHPTYAFLAWLVPIVLIIATERTLRHVLEMTVPVYEELETGRLVVGERENRQ